MKNISILGIICFTILFSGCTNNQLNTPTKKEVVAIQNSTLILNAGRNNSGQKTNPFLSNDKKYLLTNSEYKSTVIWDIQKAKAVKKIVGDIDDGDIGIHKSAIITPDNKYVVVGGKFNNDSNDFGVIRVHDFKSGKILKTIELSSFDIHEMELSIDNNYIVASTIGGELFKIEIDTWDYSKLLGQKYNKRRREYKPVKHFKCFEKDGSQYVALLQAGAIVVMNLSGYQYSKINWKSNRIYEGTQMRNVAVNDDYIAVSYWTGSIRLFNHKLQFVKKLNIPYLAHKPVIEFSEDNNYLLHAYMTKNGTKRKRLISLFDTKNYNLKKSIELTHTYGLSKILNYADSKVLTVDYSSGINLVDYDSLKVEEITKSLPVIDKIGLEKNKFFVNYRNISDKYIFDISKYLLNENYSNESEFNVSSLAKSKNNISLSLKKNEFGYEKKILKILENDKPIASIEKGSLQRHLQIGITNEYYVVSGGYEGELLIYNTSGDVLARLKGHSTYISSLSQNNNILISSESSGIIKLWNLDELKKKNFNGILYPYANIYIDAKTNDWVVWTEDGFYNSSSVEKGIAWHVDKAWDKESEIYLAKQFSRYLYRPDIIAKSIELQSRENTLKYFFKKEPELRKITSADLIDRAPVGFYIEDLKLISSNKAKIKIRFKNNNANRPDTIAIFVNASQVLSKVEMKSKKLQTNDSIEYEIPILDKENIIKVAIHNKWAEGVASTFIDSPNFRIVDKELYLLAVGINDYSNVGIPSLVSPEKDAKSINDAFKRNKLYSKINTKLLLSSNEKITSDKILYELQKISKVIKPQDDIVIFFAGHGVTNSKGYNFITQETQVSQKGNFVVDSTKRALVRKKSVENKTEQEIDDLTFSANTTLDWKRLNDTLSLLRGKKMLIVDSCQAGGVMKKIKPSLRKLEKDIFSTESIIMSASSSQEFAMENNNNGFFTSAILNGINSSNKNIYFSNLNKQITKYVQKITDGKQNPTIIKPRVLNDFMFYKKH